MIAIYARQSLDKKDSLSIESQIEQCKYKIRNNEPYKEYQDKGYSGKNTDRPAFKELLNDIKNDKINAVIVYRLDRFSRNIIDFYNVYEIMKKHNCEFISDSENFDTSTPMGRATMGILITFAQMERENIQQRVKDNYYYRIANDGRWAGGKAPYGFTIGRSKDNKPQLQIDEEQIKAVKLMYELYTNEINISLGEVARVLKSKGYKSGRKNGAWTSDTISKILQNTIYVQADEKLYKYLQIKQIKFLNDKSAWDGKHTAHIVGKRVGNSNIRKYTDLKEQSVYITNIRPMIESRTYINVMNRLEKNEKFKQINKIGVLQELGGKLKCTCGYGIKSYSISTTGRPFLDCYANRTLHVCNHKYNKFNFYDIQEYVSIEIQKQIDSLKEILGKKKKARLEKQHKIKKLEKQLDNLINISMKSEILNQAVIKKIEDTQKTINQLQLDLQMNNDIMDNLQIPQFTSDSAHVFLNDIVYKDLSTEEKKYIVNIMIDKIVLDEEKEEINIYWKI